MAKKQPEGFQKLYRNNGVTALVIEGTRIEPGAEFRATLSPEFEMQMFQGGHLILLEDQSADADVRQAEEIVRQENAGPIIIPSSDEGAVDESTSERRGRRKSS